jgi:hypothetical protein
MENTQTKVCGYMMISRLLQEPPYIMNGIA